MIIRDKRDGKFYMPIQGNKAGGALCITFGGTTTAFIPAEHIEEVETAIIYIVNERVGHGEDDFYKFNHPVLAFFEEDKAKQAMAQLVERSKVFCHLTVLVDAECDRWESANPSPEHPTAPDLPPKPKFWTGKNEEQHLAELAPWKAKCAEIMEAHKPVKQAFDKAYEEWEKKRAAHLLEWVKARYSKDIAEHDIDLTNLMERYSGYNEPGEFNISTLDIR